MFNAHQLVRLSQGDSDCVELSLVWLEGFFVAVVVVFVCCCCFVFVFVSLVGGFFGFFGATY